MPYLWMMCGSFSFAIMGVCAHGVAEQCDWQAVACARSSLVALLVGLLAWWQGTPLVWLRPARLWLRSLAGSVSVICTFYGFMYLPASSVLTLTNLFPIWVAVLSWAVLGRRPSARVGVAVLMAVAGVVLIQKPDLTAQNIAFAVALFASFSTAVAMLGLHRLHDVHPQAVVVHFSLVSVLFCLGAWAALPGGRGGVTGGAGTWLSLLGVGVAASVGQLLLTKAFAAGEPSRVSVVGLTSVVFAFLFDAALNPHAVPPRTLLGTALILLPTAWVMLERKPAPRSRTMPAPPETPPEPKGTDPCARG